MKRLPLHGSSRSTGSPTLPEIFAALDAVQPQAPIACKEGCDYCCYMRVDATPFEAKTCLEHLRGKKTASQFGAIRGRIRATAGLLRSMSVVERFDANIPCPLLVDHRCSVYSVRPIKCRGHSSVDVQDCIAGFEEPAGSGLMQVDAALYESASAAFDILKQSHAVDDLIFLLDRFVDVPDEVHVKDATSTKEAQNSG